eukprot:symbB.v1.2.018215.t1/scaffold1445.1/size118272/6
MRARMEGIWRAKGEVVICLDSHVETTPGWLEPLLWRITEESVALLDFCLFLFAWEVPTSPKKYYIALQYLHVQCQDFRYEVYGLGLVSFNWLLNQKPRERPEGEDTMAPSSVLCGGLFAVDRSWFLHLGGYDPELQIYGGEEMEIGFSAWQCGGSVVHEPWIAKLDSHNTAMPLSATASLKSYSIAINSARWPHALSLLNQLQEERLEADLIAQTAQINSCGRGLAWRHATLMLHSCDADVIAFNAALNACVAREWRQAEHLLQQEMASLQPDVVSSNSVINAMAKSSQWQRAVQTNRYGEDTITHCCSISALEKASEWQLAAQSLRMAAFWPTKQTVLAYNASISAYEKASQWDHTLVLLDDMKAASHRGVGPDLITFNATISAQRAAWSNALNLLHGLQQKRFIPQAPEGTVGLKE